MTHKAARLAGGKGFLLVEISEFQQPLAWATQPQRGSQNHPRAPGLRLVQRQLVDRACVAFSRPRAGRAPTTGGKSTEPIEAPFPPHAHRRLVQGTMPKKPASKVKKEKAAAAPAPAKAPTPPNAPPLPMMPPFGLVPGFPPLIPPPPGVDPAVWAAAAAQHAAQQPGNEPKSKE